MNTPPPNKPKRIEREEGSRVRMADGGPSDVILDAREATIDERSFGPVPHGFTITRQEKTSTRRISSPAVRQGML
ncbi:MAG: hypothetical protein IPK99_17270 [Flavobacteriales bacterium]|nr:hypothetical protein [Flavobacteriales bacterium]